MTGNEKQSFSQHVKEELVHTPLGRSCCIISEIAALTQTIGHLSLRGGGKLGVSYRTDQTIVARRIYILLKKQLGVSPRLHFVQTTQLGGRRSCVITLEDEAAQGLLFSLHMLEADEVGTVHLRHTVPRHPMTRQCCRRAFLRGAFLGSGTLSNPEKGYRLEWRTGEGSLGDLLGKLLEKSELPFHSYQRKGQKVVYLRDAQQITDVLTLMGAHRSVLEMENMRVHKQLRSAATRASNCDEHNSEKMLDAAQKQAEAIRLISLKQGLFTLPPALQEIARLRLENPELSLKQLGEMLNPPLGKSGVNHRLQRLVEIAAQLENESEEEAPEA